MGVLYHFRAYFALFFIFSLCSVTNGAEFSGKGPSKIGRTHVFWYKAKTNQYSLTDCNPGPCLPEDAVVHEEIFGTGNVREKGGYSGSGFSLGYKPAEETYYSAFVWSHGMNSIISGRAKRALFRGEYWDRWVTGKPTSQPGAIAVRYGVVDFSGNIDIYGGINKLRTEIVWRDKSNWIGRLMGFDRNTNVLAAEADTTIRIPQGRTSMESSSPLAGLFFEFDITKQINWILQHPGGQYAIVFLPQIEEGEMGGINLCSIEGGIKNTLNIKLDGWSRDGNTAHIIVEEDPHDPLVFSSKTSNAKDIEEMQAGIEWISPTPYSVIKDDTVKIEIAVNGDRYVQDIKGISFYASFYDSNLLWHRDSLISKVITPPYRIDWNISNVLDHNLGKLTLYCNIDRRVALDSTISLNKFVIDRNRNRSNKVLKSYRNERLLVFDGFLDEWDRRGQIKFGNPHCRVHIMSKWDKQFLYFGIEVLDSNVISRFPPGSPTTTGLYNEDEIEILIDPFYRREEMMDTTYRQYLIAAAGMTFGVIRDRERWKQILKPKVKFAARTFGTLNEIHDRDTGFAIEYAISWEEIGVSPQLDKKMGLEIWNVNVSRDTLDPHFLRWDDGTKWLSYGQSTPTTLQNPSEWASLELCAKQNDYGKWAVIGFVLLLLFGAPFLVLRRKNLKGKGTLLEDKIIKAEALLAKAEGIAANVGDKGEYLNKLEESNRELEEFARVASHDLQEPLRKIESFGERLSVGASEQLDPKHRDYLSRMKGASGRMRELINGLLSLSRVSSQARPFAPVDLNKTIAEVASDLQPGIDKEEARVECEGLPVLEGDALQMRQLFQNLIGNALKFKRAGIAPVVRISSKPITEYGPNQGKRWEISVTDNGVGFNGQYASKIFEPFERLHGREAYEGTGLGLSICQKIVKRHGGAIMAMSEPGEGTTFTITLPETQKKET